MKRIFTIFMLALPFIVFSQTGKYLEFNGTDQYMQIPTHADFNVQTSESFTITAWVNVIEFKNNNARYITKRLQGTTVADKSGYELWGANSAAQYYALNTPNASNNHNNSLSVWPTYTGSLNKWTHIAFVVDRAGGKMYEYIDGVEVANSGTKDISPWAVNNAWDVYVGCGITGTTAASPTQYFRGQMDNFRFWKKALSPADIIADKTATVTAETAGLVAAYDFENINTTTLKVPDIKNAHEATLVNYTFSDKTIIKVTQDVNFTGRGNDNEEILRLEVTPAGTSIVELKELVMNMNGTTDINDVDSIKIYTTGGVTRFDPRKPAGTLIGKAAAATGDITIPLTGMLNINANYLWVTYKLKETASEGNKVDAVLVSLTTKDETVIPANGNPAGLRTILLRRTLIYGPGDYSSTNYRIPAITTAADGSLVVLTDKRKLGSGDLAANIDVVANRSTDGGKTWSAPVTVALGTSSSTGFGDAAIIKANSGKLVALYVGGPGFFNSTPTVPIRSYISTSSDNGVTWSAPRDITSQIYGAGCADPVRAAWQGSFFGSGHQLTLRNGRLMAVIAVREPSVSGIQNYAVYSDDEGETWSVSKRALSGGDEAKVVELNDGSILMSVRTSGNRLWTKSTDGGVTWGAKNSWPEIWGNACDADIIRYTSTKDGFDKNRILHTLPNASDRTNVTMWVSYDEGSTWPVKRSIAAGQSAYSSVTILPDGTIGVYLEEDGSIPYKMYFLNYSLEWLTNGADKWLPVNTLITSNPVFSLAAGKYTEDKTLTITADEGATIRYTLDGSMPTKTSAVYTAPIQITRSMTVKAFAQKEGFGNSSVTVADYIYGWDVPGQNRGTIDQRYLISAKTEGADVNLNFAASSPPATHFVSYNNEIIEAKTGSTFTLKLNALEGQTDGLQWCQAIILIDWNRDYDFTDAGERIAIVGNRSIDNGAAVLNISQAIVVPVGAVVNQKTRLRVVYSDGWRPTSYTDYGFDPVDKGRIYDFDLKIIASTGVEHVLADLLIAFPNPARNMVNLNMPVAGKYNVSLVTLDGKTIETKSVILNDAAKYTIDLSSYTSAAYLVNVIHESGFEKSIRILKQ